MIDYRYVVRTTDNRRYTYMCSTDLLELAYRDIKNQEYVEATKWGKDKKVFIDTKHIVSIEKW